MRYAAKPNTGRHIILSPERAVISGAIRTDSIDDLRRSERAFAGRRQGRFSHPAQPGRSDDAGAAKATRSRTCFASPCQRSVSHVTS
jgi:hypothetical protein